MWLVFNPLPFVNFAVGTWILPVAVRPISAHFTYVYILILVYKRALALHFIILPIAIIWSTIRPILHTFTMFDLYLNLIKLAWFHLAVVNSTIGALIVLGVEYRVIALTLRVWRGVLTLWVRKDFTFYKTRCYVITVKVIHHSWSLGSRLFWMISKIVSATNVVILVCYSHILRHVAINTYLVLTVFSNTAIVTGCATFYHLTHIF